MNVFGRCIRNFCSTARAQADRIKCTRKDNYAVVALNNPPVNSLNLETLTEFNITMDKLRAEDCQGMILTSTSPTVFCAGLDIMEMYQPEESRLREFWRQLQNTWLKLYGSRMVTIAAVDGHSPAGGCLLAMSCDYRLMSDKKIKIGLNETLLGIVAPFWFVDTMKNTIGHRQTEKSLQLGAMYGPADASKIGLVDDLVPADGNIAERAQLVMKKWLSIPDHARYLTKVELRSPYLEKLRNKQDEDVDNFYKFITLDSVQNTLKHYLEQLKKPKQKTEMKE